MADGTVTAAEPVVSEEADSVRERVLALAGELDAELPKRVGIDSDEVEFKSVTEFWTRALREGAKPWYRGSTDYWEKDSVTVDINGVLGGLEATHSMDVAASAAFIATLRRLRPAFGRGRALDVAAGMGRVTKFLLSKVFAKVDLTEQSARFREAALVVAAGPTLGDVFGGAMQDLKPPAGTYDCVWIQYAVGYLLDVDLVVLLRRLRRSLRPGGVVVVKENTFLTHEFWVDLQDNNIVRSDAYFRALFRRAGLEVFHRDLQRPWPKELLPVTMYALRPIEGEGTAVEEGKEPKDEGEE